MLSFLFNEDRKVATTTFLKARILNFTHFAKSSHKALLFSVIVSREFQAFFGNCATHSTSDISMEKV
jgi:hypothetical protein